MDRPRTRSRGADVSSQWQSPGAAEHYLRRRWTSGRRARRDVRLLRRALARCSLGEGARVLDAPCGAGRLRPALAERRRYVGLDASRTMLSAARAAGARPLLVGDVAGLPFRDRAFDLVVACRLLHHLRDDALLDRIASELTRVSARWIVASFWDRGTLPAWRHRRRPRPGETRVSRSRDTLRAAFARAGAPVVAFVADTRLLSRQCFLVARRPPADPRRRAPRGGSGRP